MTRAFRLTVSAAMILLAGCGGTEEDRVKLIPVSGKVTKNGKPLAGATITFTPGSGNKVSTPGSDATGPDGGYVIKFKGRTGLSVGKYHVVVDPPIDAGGKTPAGMENDPVMANMARGGAATTGEKKKEAGEKNDFDAEVAEGASVELDFDVKSK